MLGLVTAHPEDDKGTLYERADAALYKAKELGRNRLYTLSDEPSPTELEDAIAEQVQELSYEDIKRNLMAEEFDRTS